MKALIVCTNQDSFPNKSEKTGLWLSELTDFYEIIGRGNIEADIISPKGGSIPIDRQSLESKDETLRSYLRNAQFMALLANSKKPGDVKATDYRIMYFTGGHGGMYDFPEDANLQKIAASIYEKGGTIVAIGHGVSALLKVRLKNGELLIHDKYLTGTTNMEERLASFTHEAPFFLEDRLIENGAKFTKGLIPFSEHIEMDDRLITGQNPSSVKKVAAKLLEEFSEK